MIKNTHSACIHSKEWQLGNILQFLEKYFAQRNYNLCYPDFLNILRDVKILQPQHITWPNIMETTGVNEGQFECTWGPGRRSSQQDPVWVKMTTNSRAKHSVPRGEASSSPNNVQVKSAPLVLYFLSTFLSQWEPVSLVLSTLSSFPFFLLPSYAPVSRLVAPVQSERSKPLVSSSHFLGKSEPLPSIQPDTRAFKAVITNAQNSPHTSLGRCMVSHTHHPDVRLSPRISTVDHLPGDEEESLLISRWS